MATFTHQKSPNFRMTQGMAGVDKIPAYQYPDAITDSRRLKYYLDCFPVMELGIATENLSRAARFNQGTRTGVGVLDSRFLPAIAPRSAGVHCFCATRLCSTN